MSAEERRRGGEHVGGITVGGMKRCVGMELSRESYTTAESEEKVAMDLRRGHDSEVGTAE